jgi:hypothetical protein
MYVYIFIPSEIDPKSPFLPTDLPDDLPDFSSNDDVCIFIYIHTCIYIIVYIHLLIYLHVYM